MNIEAEAASWAAAACLFEFDLSRPPHVSVTAGVRIRKCHRKLTAVSAISGIILGPTCREQSTGLWLGGAPSRCGGLGYAGSAGLGKCACRSHNKSDAFTLEGPGLFTRRPSSILSILNI